jgi:small conductance mechanosensitive channel
MPRPRPLVLSALVFALAGLAACTEPPESPLQKAEKAVTGGGSGAEEGGAGAAPEADEKGEEPGAAGDEAGEKEAADSEPALALDLEGPVFSARTWRRFGRDLLESFIGFLPALFRALVVLAVFYLLYRALVGVLGGVMRRANADPAVREIGLRLTRYALLGLAAIMALAQLGFDVGSVLAGVGILGLAVGLAAQETLANLIAGLTILWDRPFRLGDNVTIAGTFGQVTRIGLRTTRILTVDRLDAILPNKDVINQEIINHTLNPQLRLAVRLGIAYREDTREARRVLLAAVAGHPLILAEPKPTVAVMGLGESSVDLELRVWLKDPHSEREASCEMTELAKIALDEAGIEIPFPQRTLHFAGGAARPAGGGEGPARES